MSSRGELFVTEQVRDVLLEKYPHLEDELGQIEVPREWEVLDEADFPEKGEATVVDEDGFSIGTVQWTVTFSLQNYGAGRFIEAKLGKVKFNRKG